MVTSKTELRKTALIACIATACSLPLPLWSEWQKFTGAVHSIHSDWWILTLPAALLVFFFASVFVLPVFYFLLFRNEGTLQFADPLKRLSLAAAIVYAAITAAQLPAWFGSFTPRSVLFAPDALWSAGNLGTIAGLIANLTYALLLISIWRHATEPSETRIPLSGALCVGAKIAVVAYSIVLAVSLLRVLAVPLTFPGIRDYALRLGAPPPRFGELMGPAFHMLLTQSCLFAAPYIIWKSIRAS